MLFFLVLGRYSSSFESLISITKSHLCQHQQQGRDQSLASIRCHPDKTIASMLISHKQQGGGQSLASIRCHPEETMPGWARAVTTSAPLPSDLQNPLLEWTTCTVVGAVWGLAAAVADASAEFQPSKQDEVSLITTSEMDAAPWNISLI